MLEFSPAMSASVPFTRIHWYVYPGLVSPLASTMPVVTAVSVWPTCAVPVMVGAPVGAVLPAAPLTFWPLNAGASLPASSCTGFDAGGAYASVTVAPAAGAASSVSVSQMPYIDTSDTSGFVVVAPTVAVTVYAPVAGIEAGSSGSS